jgi:colanic acid/amylovoran biosynthesis glycosyltransferase
MRIYAFAEIYPSPYKGYLDAQFAQFQKDGHDLHIFAFNSHEAGPPGIGPSTPIIPRTTRLPSTLRTIPGAIGPAVKNLASAPLVSVRRIAPAFKAGDRFTARLTSVARALCLPPASPDICIIHSLLSLRHLTFLRQAYPGATIAFYYHGGELPGVPSLSDSETKAAFASTDLVFTNTEDSRLHAIERGCDAGKIRVSPVGFDMSEFPLVGPKRYRQSGALSILTTGRLSAEKGHILALRAIERLAADGAKIAYRIVGDGPEEPVLKAYVHEHGLGSHVTFAGRVSREQLWQEYLAADIFLLPSIAVGTWQENQACVVQEAMLARCVPCVSRTGGVPESTLPSALQFAFEPGNVPQIVDSLGRLASQTDEDLATLGRAAREFVQARYDVAILNRQIIDESVACRPAMGKMRGAIRNQR